MALSPQAVNFALGHRADQVSDETRRRVADMATQLEYRTNAAAAVSTGRFNAVGLLMSRHRCQSTLFGEMLRGLHDGLENRGIHLVINFVDDDHLTSDDELPKILGQSMVDGLLLNYTHDIPPRMVELIDRHQIPAVWVNSRQAANCVHPDDEGAGYAATRLLLDAGHRRITYLDVTAGLEETGDWHYSRPDRRAGYERAMREAGHEPLAVVPRERLSYEKPVRLAADLLGSAARPTAIVGYCRNDIEAVLLASASLGIQPGRDVSLVMFEHFQPLVGPKVDTYLLPEAEVGRAAGEMLLDRIDDPTSDQPPRAIPMNHKPGDSVSPVAQN